MLRPAANLCSGLPTANVIELLIPPPGVGLVTVTDNDAGTATRDAGTVAVREPLELSTVVRIVPLTTICDFATKPVPVTVMVNADEPAEIDAGEIEVIDGDGLAITNVADAMALFAKLESTAIALIVSPAETDSGPLYVEEVAAGVVPSVV